MIQLVEIVEAPIASNQDDRFRIRQIYVSPEHIVMVREDNNISRVLTENNIRLPGTTGTMQFTKLTINRGTTGHDITVLGSVEMIYEKINTSRSKQLLRG
jgi:hypothetical protein